MKNDAKRSIGPVALMLTGLGSIVGSGWLFGAWHASKIAGPAAILAWVIGAVIIMAIALTYVELGATALYRMVGTSWPWQSWPLVFINGEYAVAGEPDISGNLAQSRRRTHKWSPFLSIKFPSGRQGDA